MSGIAERWGSGPRPSGADAMPRVGGPVFIGGLDRTGKTTLAAFLASHPNIAIPTVGSNMETYFYGRFGDLAHPENLERCLDAMLSYSHVSILEPDPDRVRREFAAGPATYARLFALFLMHYAEREGKPRWGAQTGLVERYADHLFASYPGVRVIQMLRDPRDRYEASSARSPGGKGQAGGATARWLYSTRLARTNRRRYPDAYLVIRYEDLVLDTETTLREVCGFLGESFLPQMLQMSGDPERRERLIAGSDPGGAGILSTGYIGRFRGRIPPRDLAFMQLHAGRRMRAYGYRPEPLGFSASEWARFAVSVWPDQMARMLAWRGLEELRQRFPARFGADPDPRTVAGGSMGAAG